MKNALQENHGHGWSSAPYGQSDSISRRWAASKPDSWKDEARSRAHSLFSLATLGRSWTRRAQTRARLTWKPARWTLTTKPTIGGGLRLCQSRNGATSQRLRRRAFPVTSRDSEASQQSFQSNAGAEHVTPETKNWTHAGNETNASSLL